MLKKQRSSYYDMSCKHKKKTYPIRLNSSGPYYIFTNKRQYFIIDSSSCIHIWFKWNKYIFFKFVCCLFRLSIFKCNPITLPVPQILPVDINYVTTWLPLSLFTLLIKEVHVWTGRRLLLVVVIIAMFSQWHFFSKIVLKHN